MARWKRKRWMWWVGFEGERACVAMRVRRARMYFSVTVLESTWARDDGWGKRGTYSGG